MVASLRLPPAGGGLPAGPPSSTWHPSFLRMTLSVCQQQHCCHRQLGRATCLLSHLAPPPPLLCPLALWPLLTVPPSTPRSPAGRQPAGGAEADEQGGGRHGRDMGHQAVQARGLHHQPQVCAGRLLAELAGWGTTRRGKLGQGPAGGQCMHATPPPCSLSRPLSCRSPRPPTPTPQPGARRRSPSHPPPCLPPPTSFPWCSLVLKAMKDPEYARFLDDAVYQERRRGNPPGLRWGAQAGRGGGSGWGDPEGPARQGVGRGWAAQAG